MGVILIQLSFGIEPKSSHWSLFILFAANCAGGKLFLARDPSLAGYTWQEAKEKCSEQNSTLPLGAGWPQSPQVLTCYRSLLQSLATVRGTNVNIWARSCTSISTCGRYVTVNQLPAHDTYETSIDLTTRSHFQNAVCLKSKCNSVRLLTFCKC